MVLPHRSCVAAFPPLGASGGAISSSTSACNAETHPLDGRIRPRAKRAVASIHDREGQAGHNRNSLGPSLRRQLLEFPDPDQSFASTGPLVELNNPDLQMEDATSPDNGSGEVLDWKLEAADPVTDRKLRVGGLRHGRTVLLARTKDTIERQTSSTLVSQLRSLRTRSTSRNRRHSLHLPI